jgi:hypothetical protein
VKQRGRRKCKKKLENRESRDRNNIDTKNGRKRNYIVNRLIVHYTIKCTDLYLFIPMCYHMQYEIIQSNTSPFFIF